MLLISFLSSLLFKVLSGGLAGKGEGGDEGGDQDMAFWTGSNFEKKIPFLCVRLFFLLEHSFFWPKNVHIFLPEVLVV